MVVVFVFIKVTKNLLVARGLGGYLTRRIVASLHNLSISLSHGGRCSAALPNIYVKHEEKKRMNLDLFLYIYTFVPWRLQLWIPPQRSKKRDEVGSSNEPNSDHKLDKLNYQDFAAIDNRPSCCGSHNHARN